MKPRTFTQVPRLPEPEPEPGLGSVTWEQRRRMTAAELIKLMGPLHVNHPDYKARSRSLLPMPNLADRQPVFECKDPSFWALCKSFIHWVCK